ncbi:MAG: hypothetical protein IPL09_00155 [Bacteroidetes bacterium]|nr:hypothetical protein [Bacteroidota bacterium]
MKKGERIFSYCKRLYQRNGAYDSQDIYCNGTPLPLPGMKREIRESELNNGS